MDSTLPSNGSPPSAIGSWQLLEQVAAGGSSSVWRALGADGTVVAVKLLDASASGTPAERNRFLRGFRVASNLLHPGIARLLEAGDHGGQLFVVEEFIEGETLAERLRGGPVPIEEALRILRKCGEILRYAHESGVVHRDLSARNLMIERSGRVVLVDFGIAIRPEGTTQPGTGSLLGTLHYLAPELIRGRAATARSDLYALGAIAYQMLGGTTPFVATQPEALIRQHLRNRPASLRTLRPDLDPRLDRVVLRLLAKAPEDRFRSAEEFLAALDDAGRPRRSRRRSGGGNASPPRPLTRDVRAIRRLAIAPFTADLDDGTEPERVVRIAHGLAETIAAGLAGVEGLAIVPPRQVREIARSASGALGEFLGVDAVVRAHLVQRDQARRVSWTLDGRDGIVLEGGLLGGAQETLFELEDALLAAVVRALRRPGAAPRPRGTAPREDWYASFLEALGCLQRSDSQASVDRAIALLERIRDAGAGGVRVHAALGRAYLRRGEMSPDPAWRERAEASCRIAISLDPLAPEALLTMGQALALTGRLPDAVEALGRALELDPGSVDARVWLSRAHEMSGDLEAADRFAVDACGERPEYWLVHDRKAVLDFRRGRFAEAAERWDRVLELTPDNAHALTNLGSARFELGNLAEAEEAFRAAIELARLPRALEGLGLVCFYRGATAEAAHWFQQAVDLAPGHARLWGNLADAQRWTGDQRMRSLETFDRAIAITRRDLEANPASAVNWARLAVYHAKREQHAEAAEALRRARELARDSAHARTCAVVVHELAGRRADAIGVLRGFGEASCIPFELRADPELEELRTSAEGQGLFSSPRCVSAQDNPRRTRHVDGNHSRPRRGEGRETHSLPVAAAGVERERSPRRVGR